MGTQCKGVREEHNMITCLCPLQPRCGVAEVMKFMGSSPAIVPLTFLSLYGDSPFTSHLSSVKSSVYSLAIAYLDTSPPSE